MDKVVVKRDGRIVPFDRDRIASAIFKAARAVGGRDRKTAERLAGMVEWIVDEKYYKDGKVPSVEDIQDIVEKVLIEEGHAKVAKAYILYRQKRAEARELESIFVDGIKLVDEYIERSDWRVAENSNMTYSLQGLNFYLASSVVARYWLNKIYPPEIRDAHDSGDFHIHDLGILGVYTYFGKEVVVAKKNDRIWLTSFERLYNMVEQDEVLLSAEDDAWAKHPEDLFVLDREGWTRVTRLVRKRKDRSMFFVKNSGGRSVIVTEDHPMVVGDKADIDLKQASKLSLENDRLFTVDVAEKLEKSGTSLFSQGEIDIFELLRSKAQGMLNGEDVYGDGVKLTELAEVWQGEWLSTNSAIFPRRVKLTENFGYFVGLLLIGGKIDYDKNGHTFTIAQKVDGKDGVPAVLQKAADGLKENHIPYSFHREDGKIELKTASPLLRFLFEREFIVNVSAPQASLPINIMHYSIDFLKGLVAGVIDGSTDPAQEGVGIRTANRELLEGISYLLPFLGYVPVDMGIEGYDPDFPNRPIYALSLVKKDGAEPIPSLNLDRFTDETQHDEGRNRWHRVINIEPVEIPDGYIYDITTESHTIVVNGMWNHNCVGWDLEDLLKVGFGGVRGKIESKPAKHFRVALGQIVNFFYTLQGEAAGAQAFSNFDTLLAPFIRYDNLSYREVKQAIQEFLFNVNVPTRVGFQTPFTNITLDLTVSPLYKGKHVIIGGKEMPETYDEFQEEMDMINRAFAEVMMEGDAKSRIFTFPIPTYNITRDFDWANEKLRPLWEMTAKFGVPYFANFVHSDMKPEDARSMCCRLRLDNRELRKRGGGLFGAAPLTGSIGVVTINLPRIGYLARNEDEFFKLLEDRMFLAHKSLEIKRKILEDLTERGLYPYSKFYLRSIKEAVGRYWNNHFSTIGLVGMNEMTRNFLGVPIVHPEAREFALKVLKFMREKIADFQAETGNLYNLEATPAEGASYRLARKDQEHYPGIKTAGTVTSPYYTNSVHVPVDYTNDIFEILEHQDDLQVQFTGGTVVHLFLGEAIHDWHVVRDLVRQIVNNYRLPYFSLTPTFSVCPIHGYIPGEHWICPYPHSEEDLKKFGRIMELDLEQLQQLQEGAYVVVNDEDEGEDGEENAPFGGLILKLDNL